MGNFREMAAKFLEANAAIQVKNSEDLGTTWIGLLKDKNRSARMGAAARDLVERNRGATARVLAGIEQIFNASRGRA
jgi:3-deoxy-D-manno-octulosonic-acid transferase